VAEPKPEASGFLAWRSKGGKAQQWLIREFQQLTLDTLILQ